MEKYILNDPKYLHTKSKMNYGVSVDCVVFGFDENELKVLLIRCDLTPYQHLFSLVGELVEAGENLDEAANRILLKQTSLNNIYLKQVKTFGSVNRHPFGRVFSVAYFSLVKVSDYKLTNGSKANEAHWHEISKIGTLAFDHNTILQTCLEALRKKVREEPVGFELLPEVFTISQLQNLYERILGIELDKRNFRKKIMKMKILIDHDEIQSNVSHRPAKYYSFDKVRYEKLKKEGLIFEL